MDFSQGINLRETTTNEGGDRLQEINLPVRPSPVENEQEAEHSMAEEENGSSALVLHNPQSAIPHMVNQASDDTDSTDNGALALYNSLPDASTVDSESSEEDSDEELALRDRSGSLPTAHSLGEAIVGGDMISSMRQVAPRQILPEIVIVLDAWHREFIQINAALRLSLLDAPPPERTTIVGSTFTIFPDLPLEMRRKVWQFAAHLPRIIEVEFDPTRQTRAYYDYPHQNGRIAKSSRRPPTMLHVCREARMEGLRIYGYVQVQWTGADAWRDLDLEAPQPGWRQWLLEEEEPTDSSLEERGPYDDGDPWEIYYNPNADIIYFGPNSCCGTLMSFTQAHKEAPRVGIDLEAPVGRCRNSCSLGCTSTVNGTFFEPTSRIDGFMTMLHGFDSDNDSGEPGDAGAWPGCGGLRELFWIVDPTPLYIGRSVMSYIDKSLRILPVDDDFLLRNLTCHKEVREVKDVIQRVEDGLGVVSGLEDEQPTRWTGKSMPSISFQRFELPSYSRFEFRQLFLRLESKRGGRLHRPELECTTSDDYKCDVFVKACPRGYEGPGNYCLMFYGRKVHTINAEVMVIGQSVKIKDSSGSYVVFVQPPNAFMPRWLGPGAGATVPDMYGEWDEDYE